MQVINAGVGIIFTYCFNDSYSFYSFWVAFVFNMLQLFCNIEPLKYFVYIYFYFIFQIHLYDIKTYLTKP